MRMLLWCDRGFIQKTVSTMILINLTLKAARKKMHLKWCLLKLSVANNCLMIKIKKPYLTSLIM